MPLPPVPPPQDGALPNYDAPTASVAAEPQAPKLELPNTGAGLILISSAVFTGSAIAFGMGGYGVSQSWDPQVAGGLLAMGGLATAAGSILLAGGTKRRKKFQTWGALHPDLYGPTARRGSGMTAASVAMLAGGGLTALIGAPFTAFRCYETFEACEPSPLGPILIGTGLGVAATGGVLMIFAKRRTNTFKTWRDDMERDLQIQPTASFGPRGVSFGVAGRF